MRVAYLVRSFPVLSEHFVQTEIAAVVARGCAVTVFAVERPAPAERADPAVPVPVHYLAEAGRTGPFLRSFARALRVAPGRALGLLLRYLGAAATGRNHSAGVNLFPFFGFDLVHVHFASFHARHAVEVRRRLGIRFTVTVHAHEIYKAPDAARLREIFGAAEAIVCVSRANVEAVRRLAGAETAAKARVIHCGIDPAAFGPAPRPRPGEGLSVLFVGRMVESKGPLVLLRALGGLSRGPGAPRLTMIGGGALLEEARALAADLGLAASLPGPLPHDQVVAAMAAADVLVLPSLTAPDGDREGIPVVLMEAMASGLAVVSTVHSGIPELVEDGESGLLVPEGDTEALTGALARLGADAPLRERLGRAGRRKVAEAFDARDSAAALCALWEEVRAAPDGG